MSCAGKSALAGMKCAGVMGLALAVSAVICMFLTCPAAPSDAVVWAWCVTSPGADASSHLLQ